MTILVTGASGYIGQRLIPVLLEHGHEVICGVRDKMRFNLDKYQDKPISAIQIDLLKPDTLPNIPKKIDAAYYLIHSMSDRNDFQELESRSAKAFVDYIGKTDCQQIIYLTGIINDKDLSKHLNSRKAVEEILGSGAVPLTALRAGIIVGSGSASFEIIRDLVEKLPVMVAPKWLQTRCQPIAIRNVIEFLSGVLHRRDAFGKHFDIYGPDILTYKQMLMQFAESRKLKRYILTVPVMTPKLSSYWLYFVTSTSYALAKNLVDSMKVDVVAKPNSLADNLGIKPIGYKESIKIAFDKIEQNLVLSSWKDAVGPTTAFADFSSLIEVPEFGCFKDAKVRQIEEPGHVMAKIFAIGGDSGWYYADWLWEFRGFIDKLFGGVGLNRGRKNKSDIFAGETIDFWRVLYASKTEKRLLLYAEMKLPGEAWLEFRLRDNELQQTATFRPLGLYGRLYWYAMMPFHHFIFNGMANKIAAPMKPVTDALK